MPVRRICRERYIVPVDEARDLPRLAVAAASAADSGDAEAGLSPCHGPGSCPRTRKRAPVAIDRGRAGGAVDLLGIASGNQHVEEGPKQQDQPAAGSHVRAGGTFRPGLPPLPAVVRSGRGRCIDEGLRQQQPPTDDQDAQQSNEVRDALRRGAQPLLLDEALDAGKRQPHGSYQQDQAARATRNDLGVHARDAGRPDPREQVEDPDQQHGDGYRDADGQHIGQVTRASRGSRREVNKCSTHPAETRKLQLAATCSATESEASLRSAMLRRKFLPLSRGRLFRYRRIARLRGGRQVNQ